MAASKRPGRAPVRGTRTNMLRTRAGHLTRTNNCWRCATGRGRPLAARRHLRAVTAAKKRLGILAAFKGGREDLVGFRLRRRPGAGQGRAHVPVGVADHGGVRWRSRPRSSPSSGLRGPPMPGTSSPSTSRSDAPAFRPAPAAARLPAAPEAAGRTCRRTTPTLDARRLLRRRAFRGRERTRVQRHLLGCERCMADTLVLVAGRGEGAPARSCAPRGRTSASTAAPSPTRRARRAECASAAQLELALQDGIGTDGGLPHPWRASGGLRRTRLRSRDVDERGGSHDRHGAGDDHRAPGGAPRLRFLDVQWCATSAAPPPPPGARVSLEERGPHLESAAHRRAWQGLSLRVPPSPASNLRVRGGWDIPVLLRFPHLTIHRPHGAPAGAARPAVARPRKSSHRSLRQRDQTHMEGAAMKRHRSEHSRP